MPPVRADRATVRSAVGPPASFAQMWRDLAGSVATRAPAATAGRAGRAAERECAAWFAEQAAARGPRRCGATATATWSPGGAPPTVPRRRRRDRQPPRLGRRRRRVRRPAGCRHGARGHRPACARPASCPGRPVGVAVFAEEEGSRFGLPCLGSRLLTGALTPPGPPSCGTAPASCCSTRWPTPGSEPQLGRQPARVGRPLRRAARRAGPRAGAPGRRRRCGVGQLAARPLAVRLRRRRRPRRHDRDGGPPQTRCSRYAMTALAANKQARLADARATFGRVEVEPDTTNAIPSRVSAWLDARAPDDETVQRAGRHGRPAGDGAGRPRRHQRRGDGRVGDRLGRLRRRAARPARRAARRCTRARDRRRARRGHPRRGRHAHRDAVRAQPDRRLARARRARGAGRLRGRSRRAGPRARRPGRCVPRRGARWSRSWSWRCP